LRRRAPSFCRPACSSGGSFSHASAENPKREHCLPRRQLRHPLLLPCHLVGFLLLFPGRLFSLLSICRLLLLVVAATGWNDGKCGGSGWVCAPISPS
jgi:hypothetical protein